MTATVDDRLALALAQADLAQARKLQAQAEAAVQKAQQRADETMRDVLAAQSKVRELGGRP